MECREFSDLRYGMFIHYGLYSQLARGEWVMNREKIPPEKMRQTAVDFNPKNFPQFPTVFFAGKQYFS